MFSRALQLGLATLLGMLAAGDLGAQQWRTATSARQVQGEQRLNVRVEYSAGTIDIAPARAGRLYDFELRYDEERYEPVAEYDRAQGTLHLGNRARDDRRSGSRSNSREARATVRLAPQVPMALDVRFGAGDARLDLGGLALQSVDISTGASETVVSFTTPNRARAEIVSVKAGAASLRVEGLGNARASRFAFDGGVGEKVLDFSGAWTESASGTVNMGMGSLTLRFPRSLGVQITRSTFLTSFDADGLVRRGNQFTSRNWDTAPHRLTLAINAAVGSINVEWID